MDIVESDLKQLFTWTGKHESDLKQLFMWIKNLQELCKSQQVLIEVQDERLSKIEHDLRLDAMDALE